MKKQGLIIVLCFLLFTCTSNTSLGTLPSSLVLSSVEKENRISELFETNGGCELPCWWGITPGETQWNAAWEILGPISSHGPEQEISFPPFDALQGIVGFNLVLDVPDIINSPMFANNQYVQTYALQEANLKVEYIRARTGNVENYLIPSLLSDFGKPETILVYGASGIHPPAVAISLYMYFPEFGIMSSHRTLVDIVDIRDGVVQLCPQDSTELFLWSPLKTLSLEDMIPTKMTDFDQYSYSAYQSLSDVSELTEDSFYERFSDPSKTICLDIDTTVWWVFRE